MYCSDRVLVMEWLEGIPLSDPERSPLRRVSWPTITRKGAEMYLEMIFQHGVYHADPHPGNLLVMDDGGIGLLDFGMVVRVDVGLREDIEDLLLAISSKMPTI